MTLKRIPKLFVAGLATFILTTSYIAVQRGAVDPETRFRDAQRKGDVEGDLDGAMQIYREIAASPNASPSLKARALLQLASSLETVGRQAEDVYERILKEFPDQPVAAQAQKRLTALKPPAPAALTMTQIRFGPSVQNVVATDGQRVVYWDADGTTLYIGDIAGKSRTQVFKAMPLRRPRAEVSRDLSLVFLYFGPTEVNPNNAYAFIRTDGSSNYRERDFRRGTFVTLYGVSWSFDNRYVVLCMLDDDRIVRPYKLSIDDGKIVDLLPRHPNSIGYAVVSPDEKSIALQGLVGNSTDAVYVRPVQSGQVETIAQLGAVADWTLDSRNLVFAAAESGRATAMYSVPVQDGHTTGARTLVQGGLAFAFSDISKPVTSGSSLIFASAPTARGGPQVYRASLDAQDRLSEWTVVKTRFGRGATYPVSSPDATQFAYRANIQGNGRRGRGASSIRIFTIATEDDRELYPSEGPIMNCAWPSRPSVLYCTQPLAGEGRTAILSIDTTTGKAETLASFPGTRTIDSLSSDDRTLRMFNLSGPTKFPQWEVGSKDETPGAVNADYTSPDGRWAFQPGVDSANRREYRIRPASAGDGAWEHLVYIRKQAPDLRDVIPFKFTQDGDWIVYQDVDTNGKDALFRVRTTGGEPQRLGDYPTNSSNSYLNVSVDGRHFLVEATANNPTSAEGLQSDYWILQNFVPVATTPKQ